MRINDDFKCSGTVATSDRLGLIVHSSHPFKFYLNVHCAICVRKGRIIFNQEIILTADIRLWKQLLTYHTIDSGCGTVGRAVASDIRGRGFESSQHQF